MTTYFKLLDREHLNTVVRAEGRSQQQYIPGRGWVESGIMIRYFCDESETYGSYEEISEEEAMKLIA